MGGIQTMLAGALMVLTALFMFAVSMWMRRTNTLTQLLWSYIRDLESRIDTLEAPNGPSPAHVHRERHADDAGLPGGSGGR